MDNFSWIKKTKRHRSDQGRIDFILTSGGIYQSLESIESGFLKRIYKREEENNSPVDFPASLQGAKLLELVVSQSYVLQRIQIANIRIGKRPTINVSKDNTIGL